MKSKILKRYAKLCAKTAVVLTILSCAGGYYLEEPDIYFFTPELSGDLRYEPFFRTYHGFYHTSDDDNLNDFTAANTAEWQTYLGKDVTKEDIDFVLYEATHDQVLRWSLNQYSPDEERWNTCSMQLADKKKRAQFLKYLEITKRCNVELNYVNYYWWNDENDDSLRQVNLGKMIAEESGKAKLFKDPFVLQRYHFTMLRLLFEHREYDTCEAYYHQHIEPLKKHGGPSIDMRARGYVAGALKRTGKIAEANYIYSLLYDRCPEMQLTTMTSFGFEHDEDLTATLSMAKDDREREVIWQMMGIKYDAARAIAEIYRINPKSELMDVLLTRLVNIKEEEYIWRGEEMESPFYWEWDTEELSARNTNTDIICKVADEGLVKNTALWNLCAGYISCLQGEYDRGEAYFKKAETSTTDSLMLEELRIFRFVSRLLAQQKDELSFDDYAAGEMNWLWNGGESVLRKSGLREWSQQILKAHYNRHGREELAEAMYSDKEDFYTEEGNLDRMIAFMENKNHPAIEQFALMTYELRITDLYEFKGIQYFYANNLQEALKWLTMAAYPDPSYGDPFIIHINDCHDCDHVVEDAERYSKRAFIQRLLDLSKEMGRNPASIAKNSYLLANAYYNATYYGNYRDFYYNAIYDYELPYHEDPSDETDPAYAGTLSMAKAMEYYRDALEASSDPEFKAECTFMLAKCEQNIYFSSGDSEYECPSPQGCDFIAGRYFRELQSEYAGTKYFQDILQECGYFATFMRQK